MRSIRTAIIAGVTAVTVTAGGFVAVAAPAAPGPTTQPTPAATAPANSKSSESAKSLSSAKKTDKKTESSKEESAIKHAEIPAKDRPKDTADVKCSTLDQTADLSKFDNHDPDCVTTDISSAFRHGNSSNPAWWGHFFNGEKDANGRDLFGNRVNFADQPVWAQLWVGATILGVIGSVFGLVVLPILNEAKHRGIIH